MSRMYDVDDKNLVPQASAPGRIKTPGVQKVLFCGVTYIDQVEDTAKKKKARQYAEFVFRNENGEEHKEQIDKPADTEDKVTWVTDYWQNVDGKLTKTGKVDKEKMVKLLNRDYFYFLLDLANALGYPEASVMPILLQANSFAEITDIFKKNFPPSKDWWIYVRFVWDNADANPKKGTKASSFFKIKNNLLANYPYRTSFFETFKEGIPSTLKFSDYELNKKHVLTCLYPYVRPAAPTTDNPIVQPNGQVTSGGAPAVPAAIPDADPF